MLSSPGRTMGGALAAILLSCSAAPIRTPPDPPNLPSPPRPTLDTRPMQVGPGGVGQGGTFQEPQDFLWASSASDTELVGPQGGHR